MYPGFAPHLVSVNLHGDSQRSRDLIPLHHFCPLQVLHHKRESEKGHATASCLGTSALNQIASSQLKPSSNQRHPVTERVLSPGAMQCV